MYTTVFVCVCVHFSVCAYACVYLGGVETTFRHSCNIIITNKNIRKLIIGLISFSAHFFIK